MAINVTPIPKLAGFAAPAFTLGTANTAGSATTAVASDSTLLAFDSTVPTTIAYSASANSGESAVAGRRDHTHGMAALFDSTVPTTIAYNASANSGVSAVAARRDHTHGMAAASTLLSTAISSSRTASAGAGTQAITGAGMAPSTFVIFSVDKGSVFASWGFGDDAAGEADINVTASSVYDQRSDRILTVYDSASDNGMTAVLTSLDADGATVTWTKYGSGLDVHFSILFMV